MNETIEDIFTETSFLIIMDQSEQKYFEKEYLRHQNDPSRHPQIGDMYKKAASGVGISALTVCVIEANYQDYIIYVIIDKEGQTHS